MLPSFTSCTNYKKVPPDRWFCCGSLTVKCLDHMKREMKINEMDVNDTNCVRIATPPYNIKPLETKGKTQPVEAELLKKEWNTYLDIKKYKINIQSHAPSFQRFILNFVEKGEFTKVRNYLFKQQPVFEYNSFGASKLLTNEYGGVLTPDEEKEVSAEFTRAMTDKPEQRDLVFKRVQLFCKYIKECGNSTDRPTTFMGGLEKAYKILRIVHRETGMEKAMDNKWMEDDDKLSREHILELFGYTGHTQANRKLEILSKVFPSLCTLDGAVSDLANLMGAMCKVGPDQSLFTEEIRQQFEKFETCLKDLENAQLGDNVESTRLAFNEMYSVPNHILMDLELDDGLATLLLGHVCQLLGKTLHLHIQVPPRPLGDRTVEDRYLDKFGNLDTRVDNIFKTFKNKDTLIFVDERALNWKAIYKNYLLFEPICDTWLSVQNAWSTVVHWRALLPSYM